MKALTPLADAVAAVRARATPLPAEDAPLREACGRVLAESVRARWDQPATDVSMMDGYALRAADAGGRLSVARDEIAAGATPWSRELERGQAARIFTGAPLPPGADCVVMQEHTEHEQDGGGLRVREPPRPGQHIRRRGEELTAGIEALSAGTTLAPADLALAGSCGAATVRVRRRPRVAFLATGSELVPVGDVPPPGKLIETNTLSLGPLCRHAGGEPVLLGTAEDDVDAIVRRLQDATADVLVTTGGASVGAHDHAQDALERLGGELVFHTVAIRPGKPILFGSAAGRRLVFGLPGNPAAATLGFELFVRLAIRCLLGDPSPERRPVRAVLRGALRQVSGLTYFPRGRVEARGPSLEFVPGAQQSSMQIGSWVAANAVAVIPPGDGQLGAGDAIEVLLTGTLS